MTESEKLETTSPKILIEPKYKVTHNKILLHCKLCNKEIYLWPSQIAQGNGKYCSMDCYAEAQKNLPSDNPLTGCNKNKEFCSCGNKKDVRANICRNCWLNSNKTSQFLDKNPNWKGGKSFEPYPLGWNNTFKEQIRYRDGYRCRLCGVPEVELIIKLHVHHIDYDKNNLTLDNLVSLCVRCHNKTGYRREEWKKKFQLLMKN